MKKHIAFLGLFIGALIGVGAHADNVAPVPAPEKAAAPAPKKWDPRIYGIGAQILRQLGVRKMKLLSSPRRMPSMTGFGLEVTGFVTDIEKP